MLDKKEKGTWVQCARCGKIRYITETVPIENVYIEFKCKKCGHNKGLNCGSDIDNVYYYYDPNIDPRQYKY